MSPRHHPSEALLVDFAAGSIALGPRLVVASHLGVCPDCTAQARLAEAVGGAILADLPPTDMAPDALARALASIERPAAAPLGRPVAPSDWIPIPTEVINAIHGRGRRWAPGAWVSPISRGPGKARAYLLGMAAGRGVPRHTHMGGEMTCVIKGSFTDDDGDLYGPGDFTEHDGSILHAPQATRDSDCVCLIATSGALAPADWVGRIVFPLLGFG